MKTLFTIALCFGLSALFGQTEAITEGFGIQFEKRHIELGEIKLGETKKTKFSFTNTGSEDIDITIVSGCTCTTLDWTRKEIKPSENGEVFVTFDSNKKEDPKFDEEETVDVDIDFANKDPKTGYTRFERVTYSYILKK